MSPKSFRLQLAGAVAAETGLTPKHAEVILRHLINLPNAPAERKLDVFDLGEVVISSQPTTIRQPGFAGTGVAYQAVVQFKLGSRPKKLTFLQPQIVKQDPEKYYKWGLDQHLITFSGLEGDDNVPIRIPKPNPQGTGNVPIRKPTRGSDTPSPASPAKRRSRTA